MWIFIVAPLALLLLFHTRFVGAVRGCTVIAMQPDLRWKKAICDSDSSTLTSLPADLPEMLVHLKVTQQRIRRLTDDVLHKLVYLETLHLESSELEQVDVNAFRGLTRLVVLSLRNNSLRLNDGSLLSATFMHLPALEVLDLSENPLGSIPANYFPATVGKSLIELRLSHTKGEASLELDVSAFRFLNQLQVLDLSATGLQRLEPEFRLVFTQMDKLKELQLGGNPWQCDCNLRWLRQWYLSDTLPSMQLSYEQKTLTGSFSQITPTCKSPYAVRRKLLFAPHGKDAIEPEEFYCEQWISTKQKNINSMVSGNISLSCHGHSNPPQIVQWFKNKQLITKKSNRYSASQTNTPELHATLNITHLEAEDTGFWECSIDDGKKMQKASIILTVKPNDGTLPDLDRASGLSDSQRQSLVYAGIGVVAVLVLLAGVGLTIFCCWGNKVGDDKYSAVHACATRLSKGNAYQYGIPNFGEDARDMIGNRAANSCTDSPGPVRSKSPKLALVDKPGEDNFKQFAINNNSTTKLLSISSDASIPSPISLNLIENMAPNLTVNKISTAISFKPQSTVIVTTDVSQLPPESIISSNPNYADQYPVPLSEGFGPMRTPVSLPSHFLAALSAASITAHESNKYPFVVPGTSLVSSPCPLHGAAANIIDCGISVAGVDSCPIHGSPASLALRNNKKSPCLTASSFTQTPLHNCNSVSSSRCSKSTISLCTPKVTDNSDFSVPPIPYSRRESLSAYFSQNKATLPSKYRTLPSKSSSRGYSACPIHGQVVPAMLKKRSASIVINDSRHSHLSGSRSSRAPSITAITELRRYCSSCSNSDSNAEGVEDNFEEYNTDTSESLRDNSSQSFSSDYNDQFIKKPVHRHSSRTSVNSRTSNCLINDRRIGMAPKRKSEPSSDSDSHEEVIVRRLKSSKSTEVFQNNWGSSEHGMNFTPRCESSRKLPKQVYVPSAIIGQPIMIALGEQRCESGKIPGQTRIRSHQD